ncbi:MAG: dTDP-glucose 4,6-dehydratase [Planctomycetota bacterium]|nr:dTDP-glucose 4,6-dehydratase [Planctomycetota bacterium]
MKVLVTGGAGFIGSNLVRYLLGEGQSVLNLDKLTYAGNLSSLKDVESNPNYRFLNADICDSDSLQNAFESFQPDAVMHLAAESHVDRSIDGPADFIQTNVMGTFQMLQAALKHYRQLSDEQRDRFRFLHVSTDEVYGSLGASGLFHEETPYDPHSPYSASKASSDHLARAWFDTYGLPVLVTNCSNNYGPYQFPEKLIPVVILKCLRHEPIPVYGKGENIRDWLHVEDHCRALWRVVTRGALGQTYNVGGNNEMRNIDLVSLLCEIMDRLHPRKDGARYKGQIHFVTDRPGHDARYAIDASKIDRELGWRPEQSRETGFEQTVRWYLENRDWWEQILNGTYRLERLGALSPH